MPPEELLISDRESSGASRFLPRCPSCRSAKLQLCMRFGGAREFLCIECGEQFEDTTDDHSRFRSFLER
jgi:transposase-like protein